MEILNQGFDHVEYILNQIAPMRSVFERMGFEKLGERTLTHEGTRSELYAQGFIRILLTEPLPGVLESDTHRSHAIDFLKAQNEGICVLALDVKSAAQAFEETTARGAKPALKPQVYESEHGSVIRAEVWTPGRLRYALIERRTKKGWEYPALFDQGLTAARLESPSPLGLRVIDHLTNNVGMGEMKTWVNYYKTIFGFQVTRHFDINTNRTGLISDVVESPCGKIKVPINEATEPESQVQEFVNRMKGSGVQHLAFITTGLPKTLHQLREQKFKFLSVPHTYYEAVPTRVPGVTEDLRELEELGILLDGDDSGYLLQIFSEEILGPFFFEYIQRKGNKGFGEGNFKALVEAIERDQIKRGVLKA